jgi:threonine dehydratase
MVAPLSGTAGGIEPGAITFPFCQQLVDEYVLVSEAEIRSALIGLLKHGLQTLSYTFGFTCDILVTLS